MSNRALGGQVRAKDSNSAFQRISNTIKAYEIELSEAESQRIIPVMGDLAKPYLGMSEEAFNELAMIIDAIYHNGAYVNHIYP